MPNYVLLKFKAKANLESMPQLQTLTFDCKSPSSENTINLTIVNFVIPRFLFDTFNI